MTVEVRFEVAPPEGRPEELVGRARFTNVGDGPVAVMSMQLESSSLALEIVDDGGDSVPLPPPPVPDPTAEPVQLAPGQEREFTYAGFLPPWTEPGRYRVRARLAGHEASASEWVQVAVTG